MKTEEEKQMILKIKEQIKKNATLLNLKKKELRNAHRENKPYGIVSPLHKSISVLSWETRHLLILYGEQRDVSQSRIERSIYSFPSKYLLEKLTEEYLYH